MSAGGGFGGHRYAVPSGTAAQEPVLCYVDPPWAYFTTQPLDKQWGDDWNDAPYEHNAEPPYEWLPEKTRKIDGEWVRVPNTDDERWEIIKVAYECHDLLTPADLDPPNSRYSVEQINRGEIAWLTDPQYGVRPRTFPGVVWAGCRLSDFCTLIAKRGGRIYAAVPTTPEASPDSGLEARG